MLSEQAIAASTSAAPGEYGPTLVAPTHGHTSASRRAGAAIQEREPTRPAASANIAELRMRKYGYHRGMALARRFWSFVAISADSRWLAAATLAGIRPSAARHPLRHGISPHPARRLQAPCTSSAFRRGSSATCTPARRARPNPATSAPGLGSPRPHLHRDCAHPAHICTGTGLTPPTSAPGLGSPRPHLHRDLRVAALHPATSAPDPTTPRLARTKAASAQGPGHIRRDAFATSAPGLTGLLPPTSAPGLGSPLATSAPGPSLACCDRYHSVHAGDVRSISWGSDSSAFVTAGGDKVARIWRVPPDA